MAYFIIGSIGAFVSCLLACFLGATNAIPIILALYCTVMPIYIELHFNRKNGQNSKDDKDDNSDKKNK